MKRGTLIAAVVLAIGAFACERKQDDKAGDTTTTSGTVHEQQSTGTGYNYGGSPGITGGGTTGADKNDQAGVGTGNNAGAGASTGTDRNAKPSTGSTTSMGSGIDTSAAKSGDVAADFDKKDGGQVAPSTGTSKAKSGDNKSTPLGDGTSGQYTGGEGTHGGKATHGTGTKK